eukprot:Em0006g735a
MPTYKPPIFVWLLEKSGTMLRCHARGHRALVWTMTFLCYSSYCLARNPFGVVKSVLCPHCSNHSFHTNTTTRFNGTESRAGWAPFNGDNGETLMGVVDYSLLFSYAVGTFISGAIAERVNHRHFLVAGMIGSAMATILMGVAYFANIHHVSYFIMVQIMGGLMQSTGWPTLIAIMTAWFGKQRILGTLIPAVWATPSGPWGWSFITPALILLVMALVTSLLLVPDPRVVGMESPLVHGLGTSTPSSPSTDGVSLIKAKSGAVGFLRAFLIPGVVEFSLAFFFVKMVNYVFKAWLPFYIATNEVGGRLVGGQLAGWLSSLFDVGGVVGVVGVGWITDLIGRRTLVITVLEYTTIPLLYVFHSYGGVSEASLSILLLVCGCTLQACYITISTAVTSDLGTHPSLKGSENARATVTGIINGTGSLGAAVGPLVAGWISDNYGWDVTFYFLMGASLLAAVCMSRLATKDALTCALTVQNRCHTRGHNKEETLIPLTSDPQTEEPSSVTLTSNTQDEDTRL